MEKNKRNCIVKLKFIEFQFNNAIIFKIVWIDTIYLIYIDRKSISINGRRKNEELKSKNIGFFNP